MIIMLARLAVSAMLSHVSMASMTASNFMNNVMMMSIVFKINLLCYLNVWPTPLLQVSLSVTVT